MSKLTKDQKKTIDEIKELLDLMHAEQAGRMMTDEGEDVVFDDDDEGYYDDYVDDIPEGCLACGGPYPDCISSCDIFDD